ILPPESQRNTTDPSIVVTDSSASDYDSANKSLPPLKKLDGAKPISGPKTIKSILRLRSTFKDETLKGVIINELSLAHAKGNKISLASKVNLAPTGNLSGGNPDVVKDGMDSDFVDPKVLEGVNEQASILDVYSRFGFSLSGYFVGKRVTLPVVENYVKNMF
nr:hypothetical protein [Tanacetum cinerariifolium]